ncbi:MAG: hypothetical protein ACRD2I_19675 [Vicinamibacterales bacterium]
MAVFLHPHLTRGIVKTPMGAFVITRGLVTVPDEVGESLGWRRVDGEASVPQGRPVAAGVPDSATRRDSAVLDGR